MLRKKPSNHSRLLQRYPFLRKFLRILLGVMVLPYVLAIVYIVIPPPSTLMLADWLRFSPPDREWVPLESMSPHLVRAVIGAEDGAFCEHWGLDFAQMERSIKKASATDKPVAATSTITQQTAKNLFLWPDRSWLRKALELPLTLWLELVWSKHRIAEVYLNVVEWAPGVYGAEAAARHHFSTSAAKLSMWQASLLATSLPNPAQRNASRPGPQQLVLATQRMARSVKNAPDITCLKSN